MTLITLELAAFGARYFRGLVTFEGRPGSLLSRARYFRGLFTFGCSLLSRGRYFRALVRGVVIFGKEKLLNKAGAA